MDEKRTSFRRLVKKRREEDLRRRERIASAKNLESKTDDSSTYGKPTQPCYGCQKPVPAGFTLCDKCYLTSGEKV